ncbi:M protein [Helicobacter pylori]|uniref:M protein n=1 Tax=Helicobacter pylori TaxID=210 RepID=UPI003CC87629
MNKLKEENTALTIDKENLTKANTDLTEKNKALTTEKENLTTDLSNAKNQVIQAKEEKDKLAEKNKELDSQVGLLKEQIKSLEQSQQALKNEKAELKTDKDNLTTDLSNAKSQVIQAKKEKDKLEQKYAPYKKLKKLYEVFLEVKGCLNFGFVEKNHSAMDLIASVLSDSKYYLESLYNKASQELSDKGEKLAELFDLLFEYVKDNKFERLKEPSAYDSTCKKLYSEQNTSGKMQRVVLIGYTYDKKTTYYTIVDMGSQNGNIH